MKGYKVESALAEVISKQQIRIQQLEDSLAKVQAQHNWQCEQRMKVEKRLNAVCDELLLATIKLTTSQLSK